MTFNMTFRNFAILTILMATFMAVTPVLAATNYVGITHVTVINQENSALPEITLQSCTNRTYNNQIDARSAANKMLVSTTEKARKLAAELWGNTKDEQIAVSEQTVFAKPADFTTKGETVFYRGIVAQGFVFKHNGESKLVYHSEVTKAFTKYDEAYQAARALAPVCKKNGMDNIVNQYGASAVDIHMVSVVFDVDLTDRDDPNYVPSFRGMVVHGFSFKHNNEDKYVQKAGVTKVFKTYNEAMQTARAMTETNFKQGKVEIMEEYGVAHDDIHLLSVTFDVDLM